MKKRYTDILITAAKFVIAVLTFVAVSEIANRTSYFIARDMTADVSEDVIRVIHILIAMLAYHFLIKTAVTSDNVARKEFGDGEKNTLNYIFTSVRFAMSLFLSAAFFAAIAVELAPNVKNISSATVAAIFPAETFDSTLFFR